MIDVIISLFVGIIIAVVIFYLIGGYHSNVLYRGPNSKDIKYRIFKDDQTNICYMFDPHIYLCGN